MSGYYDGYDGIPDYGGPRHEGRDHRVVDTKDVVANDWVGHAYDPAGGLTYANPAGPSLPESRKRPRPPPPPPPPPEEDDIPGYVPSPSVAALMGVDVPLVGSRDMTVGEGRDCSKDWRCPQCANVNYSGRKWCNRCREPLPRDPEFVGATGKVSANPWANRDTSKDWRCPGCSNLNYAGRRACNRCQMPQPEDLKDGGNVQTVPINPAIAPTIKLGAAAPPPADQTRNPQWDGRGGGLGPLLPPPRKPGVNAGADRPDPGPRRDGAQDWRCPTCNNVNYSGRLTCNKCKYPIPRDGYAAAHGGSLEGYERLRVPADEGRAPRTARRDSAFDWKCGTCANTNYSGRLACNKCLKPVPPPGYVELVPPTARGFPGGDTGHGLHDHGYHDEGARPFGGPPPPPGPAYGLPVAQHALRHAVADPHELDRRYAAAPTWNDVLELWSGRGAPTAANLANALSRLGKVGGDDRSAAHAARHDRRFAALLRELRSRICDDPEYLGPRQLGNVAHALARLGAGKGHMDGERAFQSLGRAAAPRAAAFDARELANTAWAFATAGVDAPELMRAFAARAADKVVDYDVRELANLVWALAKLGKGPASSPEAARLFEAAASSAADRAAQLSSQQVAKLLWSYAAVGLRHELLFHALCGRARADLASYGPLSVATSAWALAKAGHRDDALMAALAGVVAAKASDFGPGAIVDAADALDAVGGHAAALDAALAAAARRAAALATPALLRLLDVLARGAGAESIPAFQSAVGSRADALEPGEVVAFAQGFAKLPGDPGRVFEALASRAAQRRTFLDSQQKLALEAALLEKGKAALLPAGFFRDALRSDAAFQRSADEPAFLEEPDEPAPPPPPPPPKPPKVDAPLLPPSLTSKLAADFDVGIPGFRK
ncbi:hypothetical protein AURANDRAFT_66278 [Aureococcus anophagefferens]|uniref:RanBP2-type domain-containing protein n=1 Tax=Aureococcus anophagefferens TaxID=44056 RepID=F0YH72_AURAN|nr:hypothetical protein AURANDRAFT_66278 [Aureococcus anophagefferens]EGB05539.1 hypothetical protein AURANDRAFT_66278 [Aureococcus anophagefferens]|eukprot:XP_009039672.1 hypothetical protein AURANDRAFT_66278 [Aureococcus anophagefferens]